MEGLEVKCSFGDCGCVLTGDSFAEGEVRSFAIEEPQAPSILLSCSVGKRVDSLRVLSNSKFVECHRNGVVETLLGVPWGNVENLYEVRWDALEASVPSLLLKFFGRAAKSELRIAPLRLVVCTNASPSIETQDSRLLSLMLIKIESRMAMALQIIQKKVEGLEGRVARLEQIHGPDSCTKGAACT